jgi:hypothetical protein
MTKYELAINEEGEPFAVPPEASGWRVRRAADGRGRPALVHARGRAKGKPLIVPIDASHADLLAAAGPGRYRLEAVDAELHRIEGVPAGCTGPLTADCTADESAELGDDPAGGRPNLEALVCQMVTANARMVEKALEQMGTVMSGVGELLNAAHNAGITSRPPPPPPPPVRTPVYDDPDDGDEEDDHDDPDDCDEGHRAGVGTSGIPEMVQFIIKETIAKAMPLIFEKLGTGGASIAGLPLEAILDWRKAVPTPAPASEPPATASVVMPSTGVADAARAPATGQPAASASAAEASSNATAIPPHAGAASSGEPPPETVPAEMASTPTASSPRSPEDAAALLNAHIMGVWQGLAPPERTRAGQLIAQLPPEARAALLAELARLTIPKAIARARAVIDAQGPPTPQLQSATPPGATP